MAVKTLNPNAVGNYQEMTVTGAATTWEALADTVHNTYTTPVFSAPFTKKETYKFEEIPSDVPGTTPVAKVEVFYEPLTAGGFETTAGLHVYFMARHGATDAFSADVAPVKDAGPSPGSGAIAIETVEFDERPETGPWTVADFQGGSRVEFGLRVVADSGSLSIIPSNAKLWAVVTYQAVVPSYDAGREVAGRMLRMRRRLLRTYTAKAPLWLLDAQLGDDITVDYFLAEDPAGQGWLYKIWQRGWLKIIGISTDFMKNETSLRLLWLREWAVLWWDTMASESPAGIFGQGVARLSLGEKRTFTRPSAAWINSPSQAKGGGGTYYLAVDDTEKVTTAGTIFMAARTNKLLHSSFIQGTLPALTGWTFEGTDGGNTVAGEAIPAGGVNPLFERQVGAQRVKIVKGTAAEVQARNNTVVSVGASVTGWVSIAHLDADAAKPLKWAARRVIGGSTYWWNEAGDTWGSAGGAKVWNALTGAANRVLVEHFKIPFGGTAGTLELMLGVDSAASNRTSYGYHASWIEGFYLSDELIVTTTAAYTVAADALVIENNSGTPSEVRRWLPSSAFTATWQAIPFWSSGDLAGGEKRTMLAAEYDANNHIKVYYDKNNQRWEAAYTRSGATVTAFMPGPVTVNAAQTYRVALRVIGNTGELDMTAFTVSLFVDGVKGTDAVPAAAASMPSTSDAKIGHDGATANVFDGRLAYFEVTHEVLSDLEISGKP